MKINKEWHKRNVMPKNAAFGDRVSWHLAHRKNCACRPIPKKLAMEMRKKGIKS